MDGDALVSGTSVVRASDRATGAGGRNRRCGRQARAQAGARAEGSGSEARTAARIWDGSEASALKRPGIKKALEMSGSSAQKGRYLAGRIVVLAGLRVQSGPAAATHRSAACAGQPGRPGAERVESSGRLSASRVTFGSIDNLYGTRTDPIASTSRSPARLPRPWTCHRQTRDRSGFYTNPDRTSIPRPPRSATSGAPRCRGGGGPGPGVVGASSTCGWWRAAWCGITEKKQPTWPGRRRSPRGAQGAAPSARLARV